jgi:glyoxylase-like metal-dependent hydrolase (beta-lactamase superfamily II)
MKIHSCHSNSQRLDGGAMFGNAPRAVWEKWEPPDEESRIPLACRCLLIEHPQGLILLETGIGAFFEPKLRQRFGVVESEHMLLANLRRLGYNADDIDYIILSHLHFDHAGGLLSSYEEGAKLLFPNAKFIVGATAWQRAKDPHPRDQASFIPGLCEALEQSGRLVLIDDQGLSPLENIEFCFTHGHTPGHMHTILKGDSASLVFAGDLIPGLAWVHVPITMGYDRYPELLIDEKKDFYKRFAKADNWIFFTHDSKCAAAKLMQDAKGKMIAHETITEFNNYEL